MATKISSAPFIVTATRSYSAQVAAKAAAPALSTGALQVSKLPSGAVVASVENNSPIARVGVFLRGGSRYDTTPGVSHMLRLCSTQGLSSLQRTGFNLQRTLQQVGATFNVSTEREVAVYAIASNRDSVGETLSLLASLTSNDSYRYYEYPNQYLSARLRATLELSPEDRVVDLVGKAAFRAQPLGNSIYVPSYNVDKISAEQLNAFVSATHGAAGLVVVGTGVDHGVLVSGAEALGLSGGSVPSSSPTKYLGGDLRQETGGSVATVAVVGEGAKVGGTDSLVAEVAAQLLGGNSSVKYGENSSSVLLRALKGGASAKIQGYSISFSDAGLLGFAVRASAAQAPKVVSELVKAAKNLTASDKDVAGAKARVKTALFASNSGCAEVQRTGRQLLLTGASLDVADAVKAVDAISPADVTKAIARAFSGKLAVAAVGNVNDIPYSDTL